MLRCTTGSKTHVHASLGSHTRTPALASQAQGIYTVVARGSTYCDVKSRFTNVVVKIIDVPKESELYVCKNWSETGACLKNRTGVYSKRLSPLFEAKSSSTFQSIAPRGIARGKSRHSVTERSPTPPPWNWKTRSFGGRGAFRRHHHKLRRPDNVSSDVEGLPDCDKQQLGDDAGTSESLATAEERFVPP